MVQTEPVYWNILFHRHLSQLDNSIPARLRHIVFRTDRLEELFAVPIYVLVLYPNGLLISDQRKCLRC